MQRKIYSIAILAILLLSPILTVIPVHGTITQRPILYEVTSHTINPDGTLTPVINLAVLDPIETKVDSYDQGNLVAINMSAMTVSGAEVWLYVALHGGATIDPADQYYAGPFEMDAITTNVGSIYVNVTDPTSGETFWLGNNLIIGPLTTSHVVPTGAEHYVKMVDVNPSAETANIPSSDVAVSVNTWHPLESIEITPTSGPAGTLVTVTGVAWDMLGSVNVTFSSTPLDTSDVVSSFVVPDPNTDQFNTTFYAADLGIQDTADIVMYVNAYYNGTTTVLDSREFTENGRRWLQLDGWTGVGGNDTATGTNIHVLDVIYISGKYFNPRGPISIYWEHGSTLQTLLTTVTPDSHGFFNTTVTIPDSPLGVRSFWAVDYSANFVITAVLQPTLKLVPDFGPVGTNTTVMAYGFPENGFFSIYWFEHTVGDNTYYNVVNGTTGSNGKFNVTVQFIVPHAYGGDHLVVGSADYPTPLTVVASDVFDVTPTFVVSPDVISNNCTLFYGTGSGIDPTTEYTVDVDNQAFLAGGLTVMSNTTGDLTLTFVAAGFRPGLHCVALYQSGVPGNPPGYFDCFTVTGVGDPTWDLLTQMNATLQSVYITGNVTWAQINTTMGPIVTKLDALNATVVSIQGTQALIQTSLGSLNGTITGIDGNVATIKTNVGTLQTTLNNVQTVVTAGKTSLDGLSMAIWGALIFAVIAAIAAIVGIFQIRSKIAG